MRRIRRKGGLKDRLPLSSRAREILEERVGKGRVLIQVHRRWVSGQFQRACGELGIKGLTLHDLRGTFVSRKLRERWDRELIKAFTGHRDDEAFRRYSRPTLEDLRSLIGAP